MADFGRVLLILVAGLACGGAGWEALRYGARFLRTRVRFDLALFLLLFGTAGFALYALLIALEGLGEPRLPWTFALAFVSSLAIISGLLGVFFESEHSSPPGVSHDRRR